MIIGFRIFYSQRSGNGDLVECYIIYVNSKDLTPYIQAMIQTDRFAGEPQRSSCAVVRLEIRKFGFRRPAYHRIGHRIYIEST